VNTHDLDEWLAHPATRALFALLPRLHAERVAELMGRARGGDVTADGLALETAKVAGYLDAIEDVRDAESLKERLTDDSRGDRQ